MVVKRSVEYGSIVMFLLFIGLIIIIFYNYLTTPNFKPLPFLVVIFWLMITFLFEFGEYLGRFMKKKNFITEGGLTGVYHNRIDYDSGMSEVFFTTQKRYAEYVGYDDYQERSFLTRFFLRFTNSRMCSIIDHTFLFEEVQEYSSDTPEGAIIYRGTFRRGVKILNPFDALKIRLNQAYAKLYEYATIAEKAKAISEQTAQSQSKDMVESVIKVGTAISNLPIQQQMPQQNYREQR